MKFAKPTLLFILVLILLINLVSFARNYDKYRLMSSVHTISAGESYYSRLQLWYRLAYLGKWDQAQSLAQNLVSSDYSNFYLNHHPVELKKNLNQLVFKQNKTVEDWAELARIQISLGKKTDAVNSLKSALNLDPLRSDLSQIYYSLN
ncbi:MAG TPA: hypothetical protein PK639_00190 [Candidatus Woesebacteria bacterium]|nr:hypothetical protein [Candidatus Woesebacteria bacterium]